MAAEMPPTWKQKRPLQCQNSVVCSVLKHRNDLVLRSNLKGFVPNSIWKEVAIFPNSKPAQGNWGEDVQNPKCPIVF